METPPHTVYQIVLEGHLGATWDPVFADLEVRRENSGQTRLCGPVDQARLHGLFKAFRDRGVTVLSLNLIARSKEE